MPGLTQTQRIAAVGVTEYGNSAVLVTMATGGELLDRRSIELTERGLPTHPHHHEGSWADCPSAYSVSVGVCQSTQSAMSTVATGCGSIRPSAGSLRVRWARIALRSGSA